MKTKLKKAGLLVLGAVLAAVVMVLGDSDALPSELASIDWLTLIKEDLVPRVLEMLTLVAGTYVASMKSRDTMNGASDKFEAATSAANESAKAAVESAVAANKAAELSEEQRAEMKAFCENLLGRMEELERRHLESAAKLQAQVERTSVEGETTVKMLCAAFSGIDELVAKGKAREILDIAEGEDGGKQETA